MEKKIILITGASDGIGKETAKTLAAQGHTLILHGRNPEKTRRAFEEIKAATGSSDIDLYTADLSLMASVKEFAGKILSKYDHLDVLINNAGAQFGTQREVTTEGHEKTMAINTLAPFLLTTLLLPLLKKSPSGRIVTVSSESYKMGGEPDWNDIELDKGYSLSKSYALSKRYVWWLMRQFAVELGKEGVKNVTVNTCEPGSAATGLQRISGQGAVMKLVMFLWKPMLDSIPEAAATSIYLATSPEVEGKTGGFWGKCKEKTIKDKFISAEGQQRIWVWCQEQTKDFR